MTASPKFTTLKLHIALEHDDEGKAIATILEFPNYRVEAPTREQALNTLQNLVSTHLKQSEIISLEVEIPEEKQSENPWMKFAGIFKDDPQFSEAQQYIQDYRRLLDEENNATDSNIEK